MRVVNLRNNMVLAEKARIADTFFSRVIGLLNRSSLEEGEALILSPAKCIHSFFMRFTIDTIFLDKTGKVVGILPSFKPFRISPIYFKANLVIELPENTLQLTKTRLADTIKIE